MSGNTDAAKKTDLIHHENGESDTGHTEIDRIVEACGRLEGGLPDDEIKSVVSDIQQNAGTLHTFACNTRLFVEHAMTIAKADNPLMALHNILTELKELLNARYSQVLIWADNSGSFDRISIPGSDLTLTELELRITDSLASRVFDSNTPIINPDIPNDPEFRDFPEIDTFPELSIIIVPLIVETNSRQERIGVLYIDANTETRTFTNTDLWIIHFLGSLTALSIRNIRLTASLRLAYQETVHALVKAIEAKDPGTYGHSERVAEYAERCGKRFGFGMEQLQVLYSAALLHDIGKIGIRESILNKPSKLTKSEYEHIKQHPVISDAILRGLSFLTEENNILSQHHERYDGKGYPHGLKGNEISLEGAIIQVADAWDAMVSCRIYSRELDMDKAVEELRQNSGTQFNPRVVDVFIQMLEEEGVVPVDEIPEDE